MKKLLLITLLGFILTGCAGLDDDFSCNETTGGKCITVGEANDNAMKAIGKTTNVAKQYPINQAIKNKNDTDGFNYPTRTKELVRRIYIASYIDNNDNYHKEQVIYFPINSPLWK